MGSANPKAKDRQDLRYGELRATDTVFKTELCRWWANGSCKARWVDSRALASISTSLTVWFWGVKAKV